MKKNLYYALVYKRDNAIKEFIYNAFYDFGCFMRIYIEVFIRKGFGERYFNIVSAIGAVLLVGLYLGIHEMIWLTSHDLFSSLAGPAHAYREHHFLKDNCLLFIYLAAFLYVSIRHHLAMKQEPSTFDFQKFSKYGGRIHPFFYNLKLNGKEADPRTVEIFYEPLPFFIAGILISFTGQSLGWFLIFVSIFYGLSYYAAYYKGDTLILDRIDEMILNGEMENTFVNDDTPENSRGVKFYAKKPNSKELRQMVVDSLMVGEDEEDVVLV